MSIVKRTWPKGWGPAVPAPDTDKPDARWVWAVLGVLVLTLNGAGLSWIAAIAVVAGAYVALAFVLVAWLQVCHRGP